MQYLKNIKVGLRLGVGFGLLVIFVLLMAIIGIISLNAVNKNLKNITEKNILKMTLIEAMIAAENDETISLRNLLLMNDSLDLQLMQKRIVTSARQFEETKSKIAILLVAEKGKELLTKINNNFKAKEATIQKIITYIQARKKAEATTMLLAEVRPLQRNILDDLDELNKAQHALNKIAAETAEKTYVNARYLLLAILSIAIILSIITAVFISRSITKPLDIAVDASSHIARGDLTTSIDVLSSDETGKLLQSMQQMIINLKSIIKEVKLTAETAASASQELSASSEQMTKVVTDQALRSTQIASASEEMSQTVLDVANNASSIASSAADAVKAAKDGGEIVHQAIGEVQAIALRVSESEKTIITLGDRSKQIGDIVNVINEIADQTNLLALNAAIEAARAGEHGRGFSVVADEIRKLSERTAQSTVEITNMINSIQTEVEGAVQSMCEATKQVEVGVQYSMQAGTSLQTIVEGVAKLQDMTRQIALAAEEMSTASEQVSGDIQAIAASSNEMSAGSAQISQSSGDLAKLASNLHSLVNKFKINTKEVGIPV